MIFAFVGVASAAQIALDLDTRSMVVGQTVSMRVSVTDGSPERPPEVPVGDGLFVRFQGQSQSHVVVNFQATRSIQFDYQLSATKPGTWTVGPLDLVVDGERLHHAPVDIEVGEPPADAGGRPVAATLSDDTPYLGQVVVYRFQFRHDSPMVNARWSPPEFDGFVEESVAESTQREYQMVDDGQPFTVQTIEVPLVSVGAGPRTIPPAGLTAQYRDEQRKRRRRPRTMEDLFGDSPFGWQGRVRSESYTTEAIEVISQPLPEEGRPTNFSGLVGRFQISVSASADTVRLGESVTLEIRVVGDGTLAGFRLPSAPDDAGFRAYDDEAEIQAKVQDGRFRSFSLFRRAVVPEAEGTLTIPALAVPTFDPEAERYVTVRSTPLEIRVLPGEEGAGEVSSYADSNADQRQQVESLGDDILPVTASGEVQDHTLHGALGVIGILPAVPLVTWLGLGLMGWMRNRVTDPWSLLREALAALPTDPEARLAALEAAFREAAALRLGVPSPALNASSVADLGDDAVALYADLDRTRYGGAAVDDLEARVRRFVEGP